MLVERLRIVVNQLDAELPILSDAERQYRSDLETMQKEVQHLAAKRQVVDRKFRKAQRFLDTLDRPRAARLSEHEQRVLFTELSNECVGGGGHSPPRFVGPTPPPRSLYPKQAR